MNHLADSLTVERKMRMLFILCGATGLRLGKALGIRVEKILDGGNRIIIKKHGAAKYTTTSRLRTGSVKLTFPRMWRSC
jgi:integrase